MSKNNACPVQGDGQASSAGDMQHCGFLDHWDIDRLESGLPSTPRRKWIVDWYNCWRLCVR